VKLVRALFSLDSKFDAARGEVDSSPSVFYCNQVGGILLAGFIEPRQMWSVRAYEKAAAELPLST
jgi:hypothetical protein